MFHKKRQSDTSKKVSLKWFQSLDRFSKKIIIFFIASLIIFGLVGVGIYINGLAVSNKIATNNQNLQSRRSSDVCQASTTYANEAVNVISANDIEKGAQLVGKLQQIEDYSTDANCLVPIILHGIQSYNNNLVNEHYDYFRNLDTNTYSLDLAYNKLGILTPKDVDAWVEAYRLSREDIGNNSRTFDGVPREPLE